MANVNKSDMSNLCAEADLQSFAMLSFNSHLYFPFAILLAMFPMLAAPSVHIIKDNLKQTSVVHVNY